MLQIQQTHIHSNHIDYIKVLIYSTILLAVCDLYLFGDNFPIKIYYLPIFLFPFIYYFQHPVLSVKLKKRYIILLLFYVILIFISFFRSPYRAVFGISSPAIFFIGVVVDGLTFSFFYLLFDAGRHYSIVKKAVFWSVLINTCIVSFYFITDNIFRLHLGHILFLEGTPYIRASGLYAEPDVLGFYASAIAVLLFPQMKRIGLLKWNIHFFCFWLCTVMNVLSATRTTIMSEIVCILFYLLAKRRVRKIFPILLVIAVVFATGTILHDNQFLGRLGKNSTQTDSGAFNTRLYSIMLNYQEIQKSFLFGSGPGYLYDLANSEEIIKKMAGGGMICTNRSGTLFLLGEIFNTGIFGLGIMLFIFFAIWGALRRAKCGLDEPVEREKILFVDGVKLLFLDALLVSLSNTVVKMVFVWVFLGIGCKIAMQIIQEKRNREMSLV